MNPRFRFLAALMLVLVFTGAITSKAPGQTSGPGIPARVGAYQEAAKNLSGADARSDANVTGFPSPLAPYSKSLDQQKSGELEFTDETPQIAVQIRFLTAFEENISALTEAERVRWNTSTAGALAALKPICTAGDGDLPSRQPGFMASSTTTLSAHPFLVATIGPDETDRILELLRTQKATNILQAPKVTLFSGQTATIADTSQRPFVESVKLVRGDSATAAQPIVRLLDEGTLFRLRAECGDKEGPDQTISLGCDLAFSEVLDVDTYTYEAADGMGPSTVQLPKVQVNQIHLCTQIPAGHTLLIDPNIIHETRSKNFWGVKTVQKMKTLLVITPQRIK